MHAHQPAWIYRTRIQHAPQRIQASDCRVTGWASIRERPLSSNTMCTSSGPSSVDARFVPVMNDWYVVSLCPCTRARQQLEKHIEIVKARYHLFDAHHRDVQARQARRQTNVAFVLDDHDRAGFSNREVYAADANVGCGERSRSFARAVLVI
jgi:hypothetical protein